MTVVGHLYHWTNVVVFYALVAFRIWAFVDCVRRRRAAFPAADKLTKVAWLAILLVAGLFGTFLSVSPLYPISLISCVVAAVYLADVRPAVREIAG